MTTCDKEEKSSLPQDNSIQNRHLLWTNAGPSVHLNGMFLYPFEFRPRAQRALYSVALSKVHESIRTRQTSLVRSLDRIFPVEPISAADLLFSILDVPLPIPVNPSDPAPPLNDPARPSINEDVIATALGYTAQVVHLLTAYMGFLVPYPITCAGGTLYLVGACLYLRQHHRSV